MRFSDDITAALSAKLAASAVKTREQGRATVSYIEGWHVIAEANRIFGFGNWTRETIDIRCVSEKEREIGQRKDPGWGVTYLCKVRIVVDGVAREGCGAGHGIDRDLGQAHESAIKEAETDAMKRAFMTFGNPFGLALYDKEQANVSNGEDESRLKFIKACADIIRTTTDAAALREWWGSEDQKKQRRDFDLDSAEVNALKDQVIARLKVLDNVKAA